MAGQPTSRLTKCTSVDSEDVAGNRLSQRVNRSPETGHTKRAMVKANDQKVDLVFANATNDGINLAPIYQVSSNLNAFGRRHFLGLLL